MSSPSSGSKYFSVMRATTAPIVPRLGGCSRPLCQCTGPEILGGIATKLSGILNQYTQANGVLDSQNSSLQRRLADIAKQTTALNQHLASLQATLLSQYNAMDLLVSQLKSTGTSLQTQLDSIYYPGKASTAGP